MKTSKAVIILSVFVILLAAVQAGAGLFWQSGSGSFPFTSLHGETVQMNGQGIYWYDTYFKAPILRGTDAVTLFFCIPLLVAAIVLYSRGSLRGALLLVGVLSYFLYNSASIALGVAYNNLFLVYIALFSTGLFAFVLALQSIDARELSSRMMKGSPHRGVAALLFVAGLALLVAWLGDILSPLLSGGIPPVTSYTTEVTYVFDLGIIAPLCFLGGVLLLRRAQVSYLLATILLVMLAIVGLVVTSQTVFQSLAGITIPPGVFVGKAGTFMVMALVSTWLVARLFASVAQASVRKLS